MDPYEESNNPLSHLHTYAWLEVFKHLDDPSDLISVGSTCTLFQNLLENYRINGKVATMEELKLEQAVPSILKWLPMDSICNLRLVCQRMSAGVDRFLEEEEGLVPYENLNLYPGLMTPRTLVWPLKKSQEWRYYKLPSQLFQGLSLKTFEDIHLLNGVKIVGKKMTINIPKILLRNEVKEFWRAADGGDLPDIHPAILLLGQHAHVRSDLEYMVYILRLERFGRQHDPDGDLNRQAAVGEVRFLEDIVPCFSGYPGHFLRHLNLSTEYLWKYNDIYVWTRALIASLPNLSTLKTTHLRRGLDRQDNQPEEDNLQQFLPLPPCPSLEKIEIDANDFAFPEVFCRQVAVQYGAHLRSLMIPLVDNATFLESEEGRISEEELEAWGGDEQYQFDALQNLDVTLLSGSVMFLSKINCPLLKMFTLIIGKEEGAELEIGELMRVILSFPSISLFWLDGDWRIPTENAAIAASIKELEKIDVASRHQKLKVLEIMGSPHPYDIPVRFWYGLCPNLEILRF